MSEKDVRYRAASTSWAAGEKSAVQLRWRLLSWMVIWLLGAYLALVLPFDRIFPFMNRWYGASAMLILSCVLTYAALQKFLWRAPKADQLTKNFVLLAGVTLLSLLACDVGITAYTNLNPRFRLDQSKFLSGRAADVREWDGELMPVSYAPNGDNFVLYKPEQTKIAKVYGEHYYPALLHHQILRDSVLELRNVEFVIDRYGLRNADDPANAKVFTLGDLFCFGYHTSQEATFATLLKKKLGAPVYNMGVHGTSPMQQFLLLDYMMRTYPEAFKPRRLLWLLFEGNDLEESYAMKASAPEVKGGLGKAFDGTIISGIANFPALIRQKVIDPAAHQQRHCPDWQSGKEDGGQSLRAGRRNAGISALSLAPFWLQTLPAGLPGPRKPASILRERPSQLAAAA